MEKEEKEEEGSVIRLEKKEEGSAIRLMVPRPPPPLLLPSFTPGFSPPPAVRTGSRGRRDVECTPETGVTAGSQCGGGLLPRGGWS